MLDNSSLLEFQVGTIATGGFHRHILSITPQKHQWQIQDVAFGANVPPPCGGPHGGTILLIKILNFVRPRSAYKTHENMYILLAFTTDSLEIKVNQSQTSYKIVTQHLCAY